MLSKNCEESLQHFLLDCSVLSSIRNSIMNPILEACNTLLKLVIDCSALIDTNIHNNELSNDVEFHTRRLCFAHAGERYKRLALISRRKRTVKSKK